MNPQLVPISSPLSSHACIRRAGDPTASTLVLLHSFSTSGELYAAQFANPDLQRYNLVAIDLLGHGGTGGIAESVTYWDQAKMILEVMSVLAIRSAFVLGTSQGGFVAARMALLDPAAVLGLILCGTSLLSETSAHGSWDIDALLAGALPVLESENPTPDFILPQPFTDDVIRTGFGKEATDEQRTLWRSVHEKVYVGDEGRRRYLMIIMCLRNRDTLTPAQLASLTCPILICHGTADVVYSVPLMQSWAAELKGAKEVKIQVVQEGTHFLSATSPDLINSLTLEFLTRSESKL